MKKKMCNQIYLTQKELDILFYVYEQGGFAVTVCPKIVQQNKNFYNRVRKLEDNGFVIVNRYDGKASDFDITNLGREYVKSEKETLGRIESTTDEQFMISLIHASSLSNTLKNKLIEVLS